MKKITLLLFLLYSFAGYCQPEGFEGSKNSLPIGWSKYQNETGINQSWKISSATGTICEGSNSAFIDIEGIAGGTTSEDYLVLPQFIVPSNGELRFFSRQGYAGDQQTKYQVRVSINPDKGLLSAYTLLKEWNETQMNTDFNVCQENTLDISAYKGQTISLAFVRVFKNQSTTSNTGDRWWLDQINVVSKCLEPSLGTVTKIGATTATLNWTDPVGSSWDIELVISGKTPTGEPTITGATNPYDAINLQADTSYQWYIRSVCAASNSVWVGPFDFKTFPLGTLCDGAIPITSLPYQTVGNTANYSDLIDGPQNSSPQCGATPSNVDYLDGNDVFYNYTATETGNISIKMTPTGPNSSVFVYKSCPIGGVCLAGVANANSTQRVINNLAVTAGTTYTIVISSSKTTPTNSYTLMLQKEKCTPPTILPVGSNVTQTTATLSWTNPTTASEWEIAVQPPGTLIPNAGEKVTDNPHKVTGLTAGTQYQYYVRSKCPTGEFSSWSGPYIFNTTICDNNNKCLYEFRLTDSGDNGWNGATMQVRQNGIIIQSIGNAFNSGAGPAKVFVQLCKNVPFDLFWDTAGSNPTECAVSVLNNFGQTLYTKAAGTGKVNTILYDNIVNCDKPQCNIMPDTLGTTVLTQNGATLTWSAPSTDSWDVFLVPESSPAPNALTSPTYKTTTNPFAISGLSPDTAYTFYVRVVCSPNSSSWSEGYTFTTTPTCSRPTNLSVSNIGKTSATLKWTKGTPGDTSWEMLVVKAVGPDYGIPSPPALDPTSTLKTGDFFVKIDAPLASPYSLTNLEQSTIYYYYIRTLCLGSEKSKWSGPVKFNTLTCDSGDQCNYTFILNDSGKNGWDEGRIQVRQNGIVVSTLGLTIYDGGPAFVTAPICKNIPFDLFWITEGTKPKEIGLQVVSPFGDLLYTKLPGEGTPLSVLYTNTGNCTAPTCQLPTAITLIKTTNTTATLSWKENSTPGATQWEVCVLPTGTTPPLNSTAVKTEFITNTNPTIIKDLSPSTSYDFYVRSLCSGTDTSTWTVLNPLKFHTTTVNDECAIAINIPVNTDENYVYKASGNTKGASASVPVTSPVCQGVADDDIWFSFVASSKTHTIEIKNIVGNTTDLNHTLYSGTDCTTMTQIYCSNPNSSLATDLTPGNTYKIRVYTNDNIFNQSAAFDIFITTPSTIANDDCDSAIALNINKGLTCFESKAGTLSGAKPSPNANTCTGTADDDVWYKFVATSSRHYIYLNDVTGSTTNVNHAVYTGDCGNLSLLYCAPAPSLQSNSTNFIVGQTYYVRVWSNSNIGQSVNFSICVNHLPPSITATTNKFSVKQLIEDVLLKTKCANITNITSKTGSDFYRVNGIGYFNRAFSDFPLKDGIVLSTGNAANAPGPVTSSNGGEWPGDKELEDIITKATGQKMNSNDASIIEFDFTALGTKMSFNFLFASNEYGSFQCDFSDSFAFLLTNNTTNVKQNIALIPNTTTPISVVTIRDNKYNKACDSQNPEFFDKFYGSSGGLNPLLSTINFNGYCLPMKASAEVVPGVQYHIKMVIADREDSKLDSAIFLEGGSFDIGQLDLGPDLLVSKGNALCPDSNYIINSGLSTSSFKIRWLKGETPLDGELGSSLTVTSAGVYTLEYSLNNSSCVDSKSVTIEYYQPEKQVSFDDLIFCEQTISKTIDLTPNTQKALGSYTTNDHTVAYFTSQDDAIKNTNTIPSEFEFVSNPQTIYARVENNVTGCYSTSSFKIGQNKIPEIAFQNGCTGNNYMLSAIPSNNSFEPSTSKFNWSANNSNDYETTKEISAIILKKPGTYSVTVTTAEGCTSEKNITVEKTDCNTQKGISPDGDGKNDNFELTTLRVKRLEIFNRYGSEVYSLDNYTNEWHGQTNDGAALPDGTYFYQIHSADNKTTSGWIYINRKQ